MRKLGQAEIGHLHLTLPVYEHVVGLDVQMKHQIVVRRLQCVGHGVEHAGRRIDRKHAFLAHELRQRDAVHVFHDEIGHLAFDFEVEHAHDGGVDEHGRGACLGKPGRLVPDRIGVHARKGQALDRDASLDARVPRHLNRCISAFTCGRDGAVSVQDEILHLPPFRLE